jgi:hypothetical protein
MRVDFNYRRDQGGKKRPLATAEGIWGVRAWEGSNCCVIRFTKRSSSAADWFSIAFCSSLSFSSAYGMRFGTAAIDVITVFPKTKEKKKKETRYVDRHLSQPPLQQCPFRCLCSAGGGVRSSSSSSSVREYRGRGSTVFLECMMEVGFEMGFTLSLRGPGGENGGAT